MSSSTRPDEHHGGASPHDAQRKLRRSITPIGMFFGSSRADRQDASGPIREIDLERILASKAPERVRRKARGTAASRGAASMLSASAVGFLWFWFALPALNLQDPSFWLMLALACAAFMACKIVLQGTAASGDGYLLRYIRRNAAAPFYLLCGIAIIVVLGLASSLPLFRADDYAHLIEVEGGDIAELAEAQQDMVDAQAAHALMASAAAGDPLSQRDSVSEDTSLVVYRGTAARIACIEPGNPLGLGRSPGYATLEQDAPAADIVPCESGIGFFAKGVSRTNIERHLRLSYPLTMFAGTHLEIDEKGSPYWVSTTIGNTIGLFGGAEATGIVAVDAATGADARYALGDIPTWVDVIYPVDILVSQYNDASRYGNGFPNSIFGKDGCTVTTDGIGSFVRDGEVHTGTAIQQLGGDGKVVGFIIMNQRTKAARAYGCGPTTEAEAMAVAETAVQDQGLTASSPLLANMDGRFTYVLSLTDRSGSVSGYAMVDVKEGSIVATGATVDECRQDYEAPEGADAP